MNRAIVVPVLYLLLILGIAFDPFEPGLVSAAPQTAKTLVLYDAASGTIPGAPLMGFTDFPPGGAAPTYSNGVTVMDTTASYDVYAGWVSNGASTPGFPILDRMEGFQVDFTLQVIHESHATSNRAGFSIIVLSEDARGIELAFWQDEIWVQGDDATGGLFRHGEGVAFDTTKGLVKYRLTIIDDHYALTVDTEPILSGPLRDYSAFEGFPDPYQTPNFLFLGDDTTSAQARVQLSFVSITGKEPVVATALTTVTNASTPVPTWTFAPVPSSTPAPSPTPVGRTVEICSPNAFLVLLIAAMLLKKKRRVTS